MMATAKKHAQHAFSQFTLTQNLLNNLSQFKITPAAKLVLLYLSSCYNPKKADMFPKQKTIAQKTGISERSVVRAIQELFKAGLIIIECKYTNRYKFTSKIAIWSEKINKKFYSDNMTGNRRQNDALEYDNLAQHEHEPIKEQKKEPEDVEDFKILKNYAESKGAKNITAYINKLKENGSAAQIINEVRKRKRISIFFDNQAKEITKMNQINREGAKNAVMPWECEAMLEVKQKLLGL